MREAVVWLTGSYDGSSSYAILQECLAFITEELERSIERYRWADRQTCLIITSDQAVFTLAIEPAD